MRSCVILVCFKVLQFHSSAVSAQVAESKFSSAFHQKAAIFYGMLNQFYADTIQFNQVIDSLQTEADKANNDTLRWYAKMYKVIMPVYMVQIPTTYDKRLEKMLEQDAYFSNAPYAEVRVVWWYLVGIYFYYQKEYERSFQYTLKANDLAEDLGYNKVPLMPHFWDKLFHLNYDVGDYPEALNYILLIIETYKYQPDVNLLPYFYGNLGETYLKMNDFDKARQAFAESIAIARRQQNKVWDGISSGNLGHLLQLQGRHREALPLFYKDIQINKDTVPDNTAITYVFLANSLLQLDSIEKAGAYLRSAPLMQPKWGSGDFAQRYYKTMALYSEKTGDYRNAYIYLDSLMHLRDTLKAKNNVAHFKAIASAFKGERQAAKARVIQLEARQLRTNRNAISAFILLFFAVLMWRMYKQRQRDRELLEAKQKEAEENLHEAQEKLERYVNAIKEKNNLIEAFEARLNETTVAKSPTETVQVPPSLHAFTLLTEQDWQEFKKLFSVVHPDFFARLHAQYPALSQGEVRLLTICILDLSSKEMAAMLGISQESLRKSRYRLRKKFPALQTDDQFKNHI